MPFPGERGSTILTTQALEGQREEQEANGTIVVVVVLKTERNLEDFTNPLSPSVGQYLHGPNKLAF